MATVRTILEEKGNAVFTIGPGANVLEALRLMGERNVGVLVVVREDDVAGIFSERDLARKVALERRSPADTPVADVMTRDVFTVTMDHTVDACMALMTARHIRHLPVVEAGRLVGLVSIGDIVKSVLSDKEQTIRDLTNYIAGSRT